MKNKPNLGHLIRIQRKQRHMTTEELAKVAGIDRTYITKIEKYNKLPSIFIMQSIANALDDQHLLRTFLKIKYPMIYNEAIDVNLDAETREIAKEVSRKNKTPEEKKKLIERGARNYEAYLKRKRELEVLIKTLEKIEGVTLLYKERLG